MSESACVLRPRNEWVLLQPLDDSEKVTPGGIVIPDAIRDKPNKAVVIAVGRGRFVDGHLIPIDLKPGQIVIHSKHGPQEIKHPTERDKKLYLLRESECYIAIEEAEPAAT